MIFHETYGIYLPAKWMVPNPNLTDFFFFIFLSKYGTNYKSIHSGRCIFRGVKLLLHPFYIYEDCKYDFFFGREDVNLKTYN